MLLASSIVPPDPMVPPDTMVPSDPLPLVLPPEEEMDPLSPMGEVGSPWMAWVMALLRVSIQSCISSEPSACSKTTRTGDVTLNEKFLSVSFTSEGW